MKHIKKHHIHFGLSTLFNPVERQYTARWFLSLRKDYFIQKPSPWLCFPAIDYLGRWLMNHQNCRVFEYGSGGSTLYWLKNGCQVTSVEHDPTWYKRVAQVVPDKYLLDYRLVLPQSSPQANTPDPANPDEYATSDENLRNCRFHDYVRQIDGFPENYFDIVLIDGRSRPACLVHSLTKVKPGGLLIFDNADIPYYLAQTRNLLTQYSEQVFRGITPSSSWYTQTNVYVRNHGEQS